MSQRKSKEGMTHQAILEKAIEPRWCIGCGSRMCKKPKQSYAQWNRQRYCSQTCNGAQPKKVVSTALDRSNLHKFWRRRIPEPAVCELCREPKKLALSNRSSEYLNVITNWWYLCYECHGRYDSIGLKVWEARRELYGQSGHS
jgi:hypothetical protein